MAGPLPERLEEMSCDDGDVHGDVRRVSCLPATPLEPVVVQATCANGVVTDPTITPQDTAGVTYVFDPEGPL